MKRRSDQPEEDEVDPADEGPDDDDNGEEETGGSDEPEEAEDGDAAEAADLEEDFWKRTLACVVSLLGTGVGAIVMSGSKTKRRYLKRRYEKHDVDGNISKMYTYEFLRN